MNSEEKRELKKLSKQIVEQRSKDLKQMMHEANPAPIGSKEWVQNYKTATVRQQQLRLDPPDLIPAKIADRQFILKSVKPAWVGIPTWYIECPNCKDLLHTVPQQKVQCSCGATAIDLEANAIRIGTETNPRWVKLIGRGKILRHPWWKFWSHS